jgi:hypothetical protein
MMRYHLTVAGAMSERLVRQFDPCDVRIDASSTTLVVDVRDQAALVGLVDRVGDLGLELVEMTRDQAPSGDDAATGPGPV